MQIIISQIFKTPYFYILLAVLAVIILCILFHKKIKALLKDINIHISKTNTLDLGCTTIQDSKDTITAHIKNVEIENSKTGDIEGNVSINKIKIKGSTIGSIRGK